MPHRLPLRPVCRLGAALLALAAFAWFNVVGLPGFLKTRLVSALHQRGVELAFTRMRLRIIHGLVCDNVRIGAAKNSDGPVLTAREVQLRVNFPALLQARLQVDGLVLRNGDFTLPLSPTNSLALTNLQSELRFAADDLWALDQFRAELAGASLSLAGEIAHASELQHWNRFTAAQTGGGDWQKTANDFSRTLDQIHFHGQPQLNARLNGDARDLHSFALDLNLRAPGVQTPWFAAQHVELTARLSAAAAAPTNADPAWGFWTNLQPFRLAWTARGTDLQSDQLTAGSVECVGRWSAPELAVTQLSARLGGGQLDAAAKLDVATRELSFTNHSTFDLHAVAALLTEKTRERLAEISWTQPPELHAGGALVLPAWTSRATDWRDDIEPSVRVSGDLAFAKATAAGVPLDSVRTHFSYGNLIWSLPDLELAQGRTTLQLNGEESEATKNFRCRLGGRLDSEIARPFLTTSNAARGFDLVTLHEPVALTLDASGNLLNFAALAVAGRVAVTNFAVRGEAFGSVTAEVSYTNLVLAFGHPQMFRAHGTQTMTADAVALDFNAKMIFFTNGFSTTEPMPVCRAIGPKTARTIEPYEFLSPPTVRVNGQLPLRDINSGHDLAGTDLRFEIIPGAPAPFRWTKIQTTNITGIVHWLGQELVLTNLAATFYGGTAHGSAYFNFQPVGYGCDFNFRAAVADADVRLFAADVSSSKTNQLAGIFTGAAEVTSGNSQTWRSWNGYGEAHLRNGLLWNIPIFGFVSPVLNTLTPGLDVGNSRATDGSARFTMTNGVVFTDSLDIRSLTMRVEYVGTVDLQQNVAARARAQMLRNTPVIGSLFSTVLWPVSKVFECEVTGTLGDPKITPVYIPFSKLLIAPLHPIRTVEEIFTPAPAPVGK